MGIPLISNFKWLWCLYQVKKENLSLNLNCKEKKNSYVLFNSLSSTFFWIVKLKQNRRIIIQWNLDTKVVVMKVIRLFRLKLLNKFNPSKHTTSFWRLNNVVCTSTTSLERWNNVVCLLGRHPGINPLSF